VLDDVPGLGPARRKRLLKEFGSVKRLREQSPETLSGLGWLPTAVGEALYAALHGEVLSTTSRADGPDPGSDLPSLAP
jgi:excinuclease ABC subunit C